MLAVGDATDGADHVHAFVVSGRLVLEHTVHTGIKIVEFVIPLHIGRGCRDHLALTISQIDLHSSQWQIGIRFVNTIAVHVVPHAAGNAGRDVLAEIVVNADLRRNRA